MVTHANETARWVLLAYRLPREPSSPRIAVWRKLRRLGAAQVVDGLVALPLDSRTREQFEWLAEDVVDAGGEASIWLGGLASKAQERALVSAMRATAAAAYRRVEAAAHAAEGEPAGQRKRTLGRLRREVRRIRARDYFPPPERDRAQAAVEQLAALVEVPVP